MRIRAGMYLQTIIFSLNPEPSIILYPIVNEQVSSWNGVNKMAEIKITKCDICKTEHRSDKSYYWADSIEQVNLDFKKHSAIQINFSYDMCQECARHLYEIVKNEIAKMERRIK